MSEYNLQELKQRHYRIVELCLEGITRNDIAHTIGMTPEGVGLIISSPLFQDELARRREIRNKTMDDNHCGDTLRVKEILEENAEAAAQTQVDLLKSEDESIKLRASGSILDRVLGKPQSNDVSSGVVGLTISADQVQILQIALSESQGLSKSKALSVKVVDNG